MWAVHLVIVRSVIIRLTSSPDRFDMFYFLTICVINILKTPISVTWLTGEQFFFQSPCCCYPEKSKPSIFPHKSMCSSSKQYRSSVILPACLMTKPVVMFTLLPPLWSLSSSSSSSSQHHLHSWHDQSSTLCPNTANMFFNLDKQLPVVADRACRFLSRGHFSFVSRICLVPGFRVWQCSQRTLFHRSSQSNSDGGSWWNEKRLLIMLQLEPFEMCSAVTTVALNSAVSVFQEIWRVLQLMLQLINASWQQMSGAESGQNECIS